MMIHLIRNNSRAKAILIELPWAFDTCLGALDRADIVNSSTFDQLEGGIVEGVKRDSALHWRLALSRLNEAARNSNASGGLSLP